MLLTFACPACSQKNNIQLHKKFTTILLNCPECHALLLHHNSRTIHISSTHADHKKGKGGLFLDLFSILEKLHGEKKIKGIEIFSPLVLKRKTLKIKCETPNASGKSCRILPVSADDILNLIIDLNTTGSVNDFLDRQ